MRSPVRDRQKVWFSTITENKVGIDTIQEYSKPIMYKVTVNGGNDTSPTQISAGLVLNTDRTIVSYDKKMRDDVTEGDVCWVDVAPNIAEDGNLIMSDDGVTPTIPPDYRIDRKPITKKGRIDLYGINKIGGNQ